MQRRYKKNVIDDVAEEGIADVECPHCAMVYMTQMYEATASRVYQMQLELVSAQPDFYEDAEPIAENVYRCASCNRLFVLNMLNHRARPLTYIEQKKYNKFGITRNKKLTFNHLEAAYLGLEQFATIHVTQFDAESGVLYFLDAFGNECRVELMPMILKSYIVDNSADDKVKDAIMQAIKMKRLDDSSYTKESQRILSEEYRQRDEYQSMEHRNRTLHVRRRAQVQPHPERVREREHEQHSHQYGRH